MLNGQTGVVALPVYSTYTFTSTWYGVSAYGPTTTTATINNLNGSSSYVYEFSTTIGVTYTTSAIVAVPILVQTVVVYPVTAVRGEVYYVTETTWIQVMAPSTIKGTVTSQSVMYTTTTLTPTTTYSQTVTWTPPAVGFTTTQTYMFTNSSEMANPNPPPLQLPFEAWWLWGTANLPIVLAVFAVGVGVLVFTLGRRGRGQQRAPQQTGTLRMTMTRRPSGIFCGKCGTENPSSTKFCRSCGNNLKSS